VGVARPSPRATCITDDGAGPLTQFFQQLSNGVVLGATYALMNATSALIQGASFNQIALNIGIGLGVGAAIFALFMLGFAFATIAAALAIVLPTWLALLIVTGGLAGLAGLLGILALGRIKKGTPPVPEQAIREAKMTTAALKS